MSVSAVVLATSLVLAAAPANAGEVVSTNSTSGQEVVEHVLAGVDQSTKTFDGAAAIAAGATQQDIDEFAAGYVAAGGSATNVVIPQRAVDELRGLAGDVRACSGRNSADITGLQANLYLDSCNANRIVAALGGGAGVAALVGIITAATGVGGAAGGIAAALLTIGTAAVAYCAANGRGIGFHVLVVGPPWCASQ
ncbi:hypothetical protein [Curtobacterium sp. 9128]|uniref:hypothetical protein n=1 Tax=Curtobacterium sp. 9128 TaxID=1793722 RepID=UPI0011A3AED6|nr:hypothetical protein [Curtobacterium sp. 9128]